MDIKVKSSTQIMLVEDNPKDAFLIQHLLSGVTGAEFDLQRVDRLSAAFARLSEQSVDILLLDLSLPDSEGLATIEKLVSAAPTLPIIVLTGHDDESLAINALKMGVQDYLVKDLIEEQLLVRAIRYAIERKRAERELRENEQRYRELFATVTRQAQELALLNQVRDSLALELDLRSTLRTIVEAVAQIFGYSHVSLYLLNGDVSVLQHQVGYDNVIEQVSIHSGVSGRVLRTGQPTLVEDVTQDPDFMAAIEKLVSEVCVPLFDQDRVVGFLNVESTSEVRLTQADLRLMVALSPLIGIAISRARLYTQMQESQARYRAVVEDMTELICRIMPGGVLTFVNQAYCHFLAKTQQELVGYSLSTFTPDLYQMLEAQVSFLSVEIPGETHELRVSGQNGQPYWHRWTSRAIFDEHGRVTEIQAVGQDITDVKLAEEQRIQLAAEQQRIVALQHFIEDVSHDLMTPISVIKSSLYLAKRIKEPQATFEHFDLINLQADRVAKLVQEMLMMSELDLANPKPLTFATMDVQQLIGSVVDKHQQIAAKNGLTIRFDLFPQPVPMPLDEHNLAVLLSQLLDNAIKYTPDGGEITVRTVINQQQMWIVGGDNGSGIADSDVPRIFDRFFRAESHRPSDSGAGLGLSIARRIVELYGGNIEVETELGKGSAFKISFPTK